jgi:hypothetical protein
MFVLRHACDSVRRSNSSMTVRRLEVIEFVARDADRRPPLNLRFSRRVVDASHVRSLDGASV